MRVLKNLIILKFWTITLVFAAPLLAITYYVDGKNGNDVNSGIEKSTALLTIQMAVSKIQPGDSCVVLAGNFPERIVISKSGRANAPTVFLAETGVIVRGFTIEADYIHVIGFEISDTIYHWKDGVGIFVKGKSCEIKNNRIHDVTRPGIMLYAEAPEAASISACLISGNVIERAGTAGIIVMGQNHRIEGNDISHSLQFPPKSANPPESADADGIRFFGSDHIFRKNYIHDILLSDPGNTDPHIDCFQTWGPAVNITIEQNYCDNPNDNMQGIMIGCEATPIKNIIIKNNIINAFRIINAHNCDNLTILNNSFKSELFYLGSSGYGIELHDSPFARIENNLFYNVGRHLYPYLWKDSASEKGLKVGYNCVYIDSNMPLKGNPWPNDLWQVNPRIQNSSENNFRPAPESPLIDTGNLNELTNDYDDKPRPRGTGVDIGAFEYQSPAPPDSVILKTP